MTMDAFSKLEERISQAVAHIDTLTQKYNRLEDENKSLKSKIMELETLLREKEAAVQQMAEDSSKISERVKDKLEGLLSRIENYEKNRQEF